MAALNKDKELKRRRFRKRKSDKGPPSLFVCDDELCVSLQEAVDCCRKGHCLCHQPPTSMTDAESAANQRMTDD